MQYESCLLTPHSHTHFIYKKKIVLYYFKVVKQSVKYFIKAFFFLTTMKQIKKEFMKKQRRFNILKN